MFGLPAHDIYGVCDGHGTDNLLNSSGNSNHVNRVYNTSSSSSGGMVGTTCCRPSSTCRPSLVDQPAQQPSFSLVSFSSLSSSPALPSTNNKPNHRTNCHTNNHAKIQQQQHQLHHHSATGTTNSGATASATAMCNPAQVVAERLPQLLVSNGVDFASALAQLDYDICGALPAHSFIGTTVTVAHVDRAARRLRVAHVGDSRALLIKQRQSSSGNSSAPSSEGQDNSGNSYRCLTTDHLPTRADENARIEQAGGHVFKGRVNGVLAVSRSVGDRALKKVVPATPDVADVALTDDDAVLVVASDGLWDVVAVERVVDIVRQWYSTSNKNNSSSCEGEEGEDEEDESESGDDKANGNAVKEDEEDVKKMMTRMKLDGGNTSSRRGRRRRRRRRIGRGGGGGGTGGCEWATAAAQALVREARDEGARDDISVVVVDVRPRAA